uniref:Uncharacterized protein n=1 Tax=Phasianus colchicus TaxID=9054 RepID=A0A669QWH0_PHACC
MAAGGSRGDPLAVEPLPEPQPEWLPQGFPKLCSVCLQIQFKILRGHSDTVSSCHFCCEDSKILSCSYDRTVKLWTGEFRSRGPVTLNQGHEGSVSSCCFSQDGELS